MKAVKVVLNVVVLVYVVFLILLLTGLLDASTFFNLSSQAQVLTVYKRLLALSGFLLILKLVLNNIALAHKKHDLHMAQVKITELKAELYDERQSFRNSQAKQAYFEVAEKAGKNFDE